MYLKRLEMQGFKSFPEKIALDFTYGITSIVGPNGSGKSNISDAVRWVMGEQSIKSLRGGKMEDVIFAGTQKRKPLGFAEVNIFFDNSDGYLPIQYEEVCVTRRVFRSGESEYMINKSICRLKDIQELFMDTGIGKDGFSIVGQGKIDEIISGKPTDRRRFFEEAAGISKYRYKKDEAERKLGYTQENLLRVTDIILELESQVGPLEIQSEKAKKYLRMKEDLKKLEVNLSIHQIDKYKDSLGQIKSVFDIAESDLETVKTELETLDKDLEQLMLLSNESDVLNEKLLADKYEDESKISNFKSQITIFQNNIENNNQNIQRILLQMEVSEKRIKEFLQYTSEHKESLEALSISKTELENELLKLTNSQNEILAALVNDEKKLSELKDEELKIHAEHASLSAKVESFVNLRDNHITRRSEIEAEIKAKSDKKTAIQIEVEKELEKSDALDKKAKVLQRETEALNGDLSLKNSALKELTEKTNQLSNILSQKTNRKNILSDMEESNEGYFRSVKDVLNAAKTGAVGNCKVYGTVSQIIGVDQKYVTAVEVALLSSMQFVVVGSEDDAKVLVEHLKTTKSGRVTFLPLSSVRASTPLSENLRNEKGFCCFGHEAVQYDKQFDGIIKNLIGKTLIVDNFDNAVRIMKKNQYSFKIVTLDGEILNAGGSITGGSIVKGSGILSRRPEILSLEKEIAELGAQLKKQNDEEANLKSTIAEINDKLRHQNALFTQLNNDKITVLSELKHQKNAIDSITIECDELKKLFETLEKNLNFDEQNNENYKQELTVLTARVDHIISEKEAVLSLIEKLNVKRGALEDTINEQKTKLIYLSKDYETCSEKLQSTSEELNRSTETKNAYQQEINSFHERNEDLKSDIEFKNEQIQQFEETLVKIDEDILRNKASKSEYSLKITEQQSSSKDKRERLMVLQQEFTRLETKKTKEQTELEAIYNFLWEDYELTYSDALAFKEESFSISSAQRSIGKIKGDIKELGNVNVDAIEQYKVVRERYDFLTAQRDDLVSAKKDLEYVIDEMLILMKQIFAKQFEKINRSFEGVYKELFGGGMANLKLTDPSDILESGIEIDVQPPGKKLTSISLLSGGEKAFTAIALLFAVLSLKTVPFCMFDEIEAALDDVNVYRFAEYIKKFTQNIQFIVITHRRGTMEASDILYGVTMQEKGVSKLLKLDIDKVEGDDYKNGIA